MYSYVPGGASICRVQELPAVRVPEVTTPVPVYVPPPDGTIVIRRTFDSSVPVQPKPGTDLQLGDYYPSDNSGAQPVSGHLSSDSTMVFHVKPSKPASAVSYTWTFGKAPERSTGK